MICPRCHKEFTPTNKKQKYCCKKCFMTYYDSKEAQAKREQKKKAESSRPEFVCQSCGYKFQLDFSPQYNLLKLEQLKCPKCKRQARRND